ncbi:hypothetical protein SELR_23090 [Selenomonas ruminantium subsp. lactilytica TAM6421]|uniref:DUF2225 domain-containing protein n=1 Tax=Selenomonas ruminantium subsp. lactilytica (strain NBRC 103574 / TAM6421) TaxID=927704 RepID=I0GTD0_SELRL|nr:DUF2225 domain-containing protein [Selenomonas ruminantium]BAL84017.1 hypothetical protein SELR_23090 [Selenomonas ruminantium subsp. lactilytica TAM6421]
MGEFTFTVEKQCPICGESTRVVKTKSKLSVERTDEDFCVHYKGFNPYLYKIWFCEKCGYAADEKTFLGSMPVVHKRKIKEFLDKKKLGMEFVEVRRVPDAVAAYKLAIFYAEMTDQPLAKQAGMYLGLAWIYRYSAEKDKEMEMLQQAADLYDKSLMTERYPQNGMSDDMALYLVGAIYVRMQNYEKATQYISRLIGDQGLRERDIHLYKQARDLWQTIREDKEDAK